MMIDDFDSLPHAQDSEGKTFATNVRVSMLGVSPIYGASFSPFSDQTLGDDWEEWCHFTFKLTLGPAIRDTIKLGESMQIQEITAIDHRLTEELGEELSQVLIEAGLPFRQGKENMRGHREWSKYMAAIEASAAPGHLPIVFALHSVLFRMPLASALQSYCWLEWKAGHRALEQQHSAGHPEAPPALFLIAKETISKVLKPESEEGFPQLKAI